MSKLKIYEFYERSEDGEDDPFAFIERVRAKNEKNAWKQYVKGIKNFSIAQAKKEAKIEEQTDQKIIEEIYAHRRKAMA